MSDSPIRRRPHRARRWLAAGLLLCLAFVPPAMAKVSDNSEAKIEAAFLVNFLRFTQWPPPRFESAHSPYVLSVAGSAEVTTTVRQIASAAGLVHGRPIHVVRIGADNATSRQALRASHLVFVHRSSAMPQARLIGAVRGNSVLTVGNSPGFTRDGGMLGLTRSGARVGFTANPNAIHAAGLTVSSKVLKLAHATTGTAR